MKNPAHLQASVEEQAICVTCGFCCDATLFLHAVLHPGEQGSLPEKIEQNYRRENDKEYFIQPCPYFNAKCTIYDSKRAIICGSYRCQLLNDYTAGKVTISEALEIVREAMTMRNSLTEQYRKLSGNSTDECFRLLMRDLGKIQNTNPGGETYNRDIDILQARCNILEALLIRHFRAERDFEKLIMA